MKNKGFNFVTESIICFIVYTILSIIYIFFATFFTERLQWVQIVLFIFVGIPLIIAWGIFGVYGFSYWEISDNQVFYKSMFIKKRISLDDNTIVKKIIVMISF